VTLHLGLDLGGTNVKWALVERDGETAVVGRGTAATRASDGPARVVERLAEVGGHALGGERPASIGIGLPGVFDAARGTATFLPNLPGDWDGVDVVGPVAASLAASATLVNDARAFAFGELRLGAARGCRTAVFVTLGTGVGGGIAVDGRLHLGLGTAGELGHQTVIADGPLCTCGNRGCVETLVCAGAIAAAGGCATVEETVASARAGDRVARAALDRAARFLGLALANTVVLLAPERIVVGGGVVAAGGLPLEPLRDELLRRVHVAPVERVDVVPSALGPCAGAIGAALWAAEAPSARPRRAVPFAL
jgi:glucokinase